MSEYKLVPVEPTKEQIEEFKSMWTKGFCDDQMALNCYKAFLDAAPAVQGDGCPGVGCTDQGCPAHYASVQGEPGKTYGCHCDLEEGMEPDGCVIDSNEHLLCNYATHIEVKEQCSYWRVIASDANQEHQ